MSSLTGWSFRSFRRLLKKMPLQEKRSLYEYWDSAAVRWFLTVLHTCTEHFCICLQRSLFCFMYAECIYTDVWNYEAHARNISAYYNMYIHTYVHAYACTATTALKIDRSHSPWPRRGSCPNIKKTILCKKKARITKYAAHTYIHVYISTQCVYNTVHRCLPICMHSRNIHVYVSTLYIHNTICKCLPTCM